MLIPRRARWLPPALSALALLLGTGATGSVETELEEGIGRWMAEVFIAQRGRLSQPPIDDWVVGLGRELVAHSPRRDLDYHFVVLDSPEANGFALPGGWVFVTAGLLESMRNEDELAAVMAHELAHLANRDFQRVAVRTAVFLGIAELLRREERTDLVPLVRAVQLVNSLHHSREREAQADRAGAGIAWAAGYDPIAMTSFLGDEPKWSYLQMVFATHPHPNRRSQWLRERVGQLRQDDPSGAARMAESLIDRGRCSAARRLLAEPLPGLEQERLRLLERAAQCAVPSGESARGGLLPSASTDAVLAAGEALARARRRNEAARTKAWQRLRRLWRDHHINRALTVAQAYDPEIRDPAYLGLLAQAAHLMHRALRGGNLVARTLTMRSTTARGVTELAEELCRTRAAADDGPVLVRAAAELADAARRLERQASEVGDLSRLAREYHESGRLVAPLLIELALAGEGDPLGRLVFSRFMVIETQVRTLDRRIGDLDHKAETIAAGAWEESVRLRRLQLTVAGIAAGPSARRAMAALTSRRVCPDSDELLASWEELGGLGEAVLAAIRRGLEPDDARFSSDLRATQILMRIAFLRAKEQVAWGEKGNASSEGAGTVALRGAVGHPQQPRRTAGRP